MSVAIIQGMCIDVFPLGEGAAHVARSLVVAVGLAPRLATKLTDRLDRFGSSYRDPKAQSAPASSCLQLFI